MSLSSDHRSTVIPNFVLPDTGFVLVTAPVLRDGNAREDL